MLSSEAAPSHIEFIIVDFIDIFIVFIRFLFIRACGKHYCTSNFQTSPWPSLAQLPPLPQTLLEQ